jgi:hypothetical protein
MDRESWRSQAVSLRLVRWPWLRGNNWIGIALPHGAQKMIQSWPSDLVEDHVRDGQAPNHGQLPWPEVLQNCTVLGQAVATALHSEN